MGEGGRIDPNNGDRPAGAGLLGTCGGIATGNGGTSLASTAEVTVGANFLGA